MTKTSVRHASVTGLACALSLVLLCHLAECDSAARSRGHELAQLQAQRAALLQEVARLEAAGALHDGDSGRRDRSLPPRLSSSQIADLLGKEADELQPAYELARAGALLACVELRIRELADGP